LIIDPRRRVGT